MPDALARANAVMVEFDVAARMRDGVTLRANVYRPAGTGPWPTLLLRTCYGKDLPDVMWCGIDPVRAAGQGFMVVVQDVRGRFASDGEWDPFRFEHSDGFDTVEWAARLPGASGRVGMYGGSYCGSTQWTAAIERSPSLAAIAPVLTWCEPMDGLFARGGAVELGLVVSWSLLHGIAQLGRDGAGGGPQRVEALVDAIDRIGEEAYWELPVADGSALRPHGLPDLGSIRALADARIAQRCRVAGFHDRVELPSFHVAGWYDIFQQGTLDNHAAMAQLGRESRLVVGPWTHLAFGDPVGDRRFGLRAGRDGVPVHGYRDLNDLQLAWFRHQLAPGPEVELPAAPVRIFVMGRNVWREESSWPPQRAVRERWFLHAGGGLAPVAPAAGDRPSELDYDPADPVPTVGGPTVMSSGHPAGPLDQAAVEARDDVLVFSSEPLREDVEVTGRVRVVLHAASSAPSTDWVARLCDVDPDGRSLNICDGILRVAEGARESGRYEIDLWSTSNVFLRGHRLRVHVTSSSFPRWDRNLNTGDQGAGRYETARQRIHHDADRPSHIELPVIP